jgi:hypothetical protein
MVSIADAIHCFNASVVGYLMILSVLDLCRLDERMINPSMLASVHCTNTHPQQDISICTLTCAGVHTNCSPLKSVIYIAILLF